MSNRPPLTRKTAARDDSSLKLGEESSALCGHPAESAQNGDNREVAVDILQQMGRLLDELLKAPKTPEVGRTVEAGQSS